jgi:serine/threonine-protein kinase
VLAEMLTGRAPFARDTPGATLDAVLHHDPLPVLASDPRVPSALVELAGKLLAKDPRRRLPDAPSLIEALEPIRVRYSAEAVDLATYLRAPASYIPPPPPELSSLEWKGSTKGRQAVPSRRRVGWGVAASVVVLALLAVVGTRLASEQASSLSGGPSSAPRTAVVGDPPAERPPESPDPPSGVDAVSEAADPPPAEQLPGEGEISPETEEDAEPPGEGAAEGDGAAAVEATSDAEEPIRSPGAESAPGTLVVVAEPWAEVRVDGEVVGTTPLGMLTLPVGQHVVSFANPEFPSHEVEVEVESGEEARLAVSLWDLVGRVTVEASPWAEVFVDGVYWDTVPPQARPLILRPGSHRLVFRHPALDTHELTLRIAAGESRTLRINLNAPPATEGESLP